MNTLFPLGCLIAIVLSLLWISRRAGSQRIFRWLPVPLWCYILPMLAVTFGWMPRDHSIYRTLTDHLLPFALMLLLIGVNIPAVMRVGTTALLAGALGALGTAACAVGGVWLLQTYLPAEAWKGAGTLAATWTGGSSNLLALRAVLDTPDAIFAPLVIVDAIVAYSWMALLVAASGFQEPINRWLGVRTIGYLTDIQHAEAPAPLRGRMDLAACIMLVLVVLISLRWAAGLLPTGPIVSSAKGWTILLATSAAIGLSLIPAARRLGASGESAGYTCLYVVLAATGAQATLEALREAPVWLGLGFGIVCVHGLILLTAARIWKWPIGIIATASQANIGGFVSGPLVGAVYHKTLAPVGLLLAMAGSALGTYIGAATAMAARLLTQG